VSGIWDLQPENVMVNYCDDRKETSLRQKFPGMRAFSVRSYNCAELLDLLISVHFVLPPTPPPPLLLLLLMPKAPT
jgi:hypothetical protein